MTSAPQPREEVKPNKVVTRSQSRKHFDLTSLADSHERQLKLLRKVRKAESDSYYWSELTGYIGSVHSRLIRKVRKHLRTARKVEESLLKLVEQEEDTVTSRSDLHSSVSKLSSCINMLSEDLDNNF